MKKNLKVSRNGSSSNSWRLVKLRSTPTLPLHASNRVEWGRGPGFLPYRWIFARSSSSRAADGAFESLAALRSSAMPSSSKAPS